MLFDVRRLVKDKDVWSSECQRNETVVLQEAAPEAEVQKELLETDQGKTVIVEKWVKSQKETTMKSTQRWKQEEPNLDRRKVEIRQRQRLVKS